MVEKTGGSNSDKMARLRPFAKVLECTDDHTLRKFALYASVQMTRAGLLPCSIVRDGRDRMWLLLNQVFDRPSVQLALLLCMQHYFI